MTTPPAEHDLDRLLAEETFVRDLARHLVAGDADEVVQQTWLHALRRGGQGVERPRHWLARILRNVASNLRRDVRRRRRREGAAAPADLVPSSAELTLREERRRALVAAVDALPGPLRTVVLLRWFDGHPPRRIAAALGVPAATVSMQLHRALVLLRQRLDEAHHGDRRAWLVPLVPFALRPELPPAPVLPLAAPSAAAPLAFGAIAMTTKSKFAVGAAAVLAAAATLWWLDPSAPAAGPLPAAGPGRVDAVRSPLDASGPAADAAPATAPAREAAPAAPSAASTGTVVVHVRFGDDRAPAADTPVELLRSGGDPRYDGRRARTDATGTVRYDDVLPGRLRVSSGMSPGQRFELAAGQTVEIDLDLEAGLTVTGRVVDGSGSPVAGAAVEVTMMARADTFPEVLARTGADGRFTVRACPETTLVGARAPGHTASAVKFLHGKKGNTAEVELVLGPDGGAVTGTVVDARGAPIAGAAVIVGKGELSGIPGRDHIPPFPALARTDDEGRFLAIGVPAGDQPLAVRAPGFAPWRGTCVVAAGATVAQRLVLDDGGAVRGVVRNAAGAPVERAEVEMGQWQDLEHNRTFSAADGSYELTGLPLGEVRLAADHDDFGKAEALARTTAGAAAVVDLQLSRGLELQGRVVDADGQPVGGVFLECMAEASAQRWATFVRADAAGRFVIGNCPEAGTIRITVRAQGHAELLQRGVDPRTRDLVLQLAREARRSVQIVGLVVDADGRPVANASALAYRRDARGTSGLTSTGNDGRFALAAVPPGDWQVTVRAPDHPEFQSERRTLAADGRWDLGTIALPRGGTARVRLVGDKIEGAGFHVVDAARTRAWAMAGEDPGSRTTKLAPGDYLLQVTGKAVAAMVVPFAIRAGEETIVDVTLVAGTAQRFVCGLPAGTTGDGVTLWVQRGGATIGRAWASLGDGEPSAELALAPGDYTVMAEIGTLRGTAAFRVGDAGGAPVRVPLR